MSSPERPPSYADIAACILEADPDRKVERSAALAESIVHASHLIGPDEPAQRFEHPGRPAKPELVHPRELKQRKLSTQAGRAALLHAVAHIEFNAINLAWDAAYRFRGLPFAYVKDWASVAADEARHFAMVRDRLRELNTNYGDYPAHNGLWDMALRTQHDLVARMALVPRVLEARGLDVTPGMIDRLTQAGDTASVAVLTIILEEERGHVDIGSRWFAYACKRANLDAEATFQHLVYTHMGTLRGPFNLEARHQAGFTQSELSWLQDQDQPSRLS